MERMAIFVDGQTERVFAEKLIEAMAGKRQLHIDIARACGGGRLVTRQWREVRISRPNAVTQYYIIIYESANDGRVLSDVRDQYDTLTRQGFDPIIGLRDVYPFARADVPTIRSDFALFSPPGRVTPALVLAIMEIEAWFIGEHTHFERMDPTLTRAALTSALGYDAATVDVTAIPIPSDDLRMIYSSVGLGYNKSIAHVARTARALSYDEVYVNLRQRIPDLDKLIQLIDGFFARS
jgi:hypothetical protein